MNSSLFAIARKPARRLTQGRIQLIPENICPRGTPTGLLNLVAKDWSHTQAYEAEPQEGSVGLRPISVYPSKYACALSVNQCVHG